MDNKDFILEELKVTEEFFLGEPCYSFNRHDVDKKAIEGIVFDLRGEYEYATIKDGKIVYRKPEEVAITQLLKGRGVIKEEKIYFRVGSSFFKKMLTRRQEIKNLRESNPLSKYVYNKDYLSYISRWVSLYTSAVCSEEMFLTKMHQLDASIYDEALVIEVLGKVA